jgi:hypothetical protein
MKKLLAFALALCLAMVSFTACGPTKTGPNINSSKTQIYTYIFNGGYGNKWINDAAQEFNKQSDKYQVIILPEKTEYAELRDNLKVGSSTYDILGYTFDIQELVSMNLIEDMSDVWQAKPDGDSGLTIENKMRDSEYFKTSFSVDNKQYALPLNDGMRGLVFDYGLFLENGFLFGKDGGLITDPAQELSVGKDGKTGTFDDGQPVNIEQWETMLRAIRDSGMYAFQWPGAYSYYLAEIFPNLTLAYEGENNFYLNYTLSGEYTKKSGEKIQITPENGFKVYEMEGRLKALQFMKKYFADATYYHPNSFKIGTSHINAQNSFISGYKNSPSNPPSAFLVEGDWWENEARGFFNALSSNGEVDRGYGKREYRFMMFPNLDGQSVTNKHVVSIGDMEQFIIKKQKDEAKIKGSKEFLKFLHQDKWLKGFTTETGGIRPYKYELTADELSKMTPFAQNVWKTYYSEDTIKYRYRTTEYSTKNYYYSKIDFAFTKKGDATWIRPIDGLMNMTAEEYFNGAKDYYAQNWSNFLSNLKK